MAHNIWTDKAGKAHAAFAIEAAWHKLGVVLPNLMTAKEAMKAAGLDWEVEKRPLFWVDKNSEATETDAFGVFRNSDDEMLGVVTDFYKPIQNADGFKHVDVLVEAVNGAHYSAAGALGKGEQVWCLAKIPLELRIKGTDDKSDTYLLFSTRHDGKGSAICKIVVTRVVCQNTFDMAMRENGSFFRVSHFGDVGKKMKAAQDLMKDVTGQLRSLEEKMNILAQRKMDKASFLAVMDKLFPPSEAELAQRSASQKAANTARDNKLAEIAGLYESNDKGAIPEIKGTAYNLLNAVIEYTDHHAGTDASRARSAMFGQGADLKHEALDVILETTEGNQVIQRIVSKPMKQQAPGLSKTLTDIVGATSDVAIAKARSKQARSN